MYQRTTAASDRAPVDVEERGDGADVETVIAMTVIQLMPLDTLRP